MSSAVKTILGNGKLRGAIEGIFLRSRYKDPFGAGGPFNGQEVRKNIFLDIMNICNVQVIVETGSFRGTTTELFASTGLPVFSCELHPRFYMYTRMRFYRRRQVHLKNSDSRSFLRSLASDPSLKDKVVFFYLDAHWNKDLPLKEEIEIIFGHWKNAIIMIDDFKVEEDPGYGYDDYGPGAALEVNYLKKTGLPCRLFFPVSSSHETGQRRGSVVLTSGDIISGQLEKNVYLRAYDR